ncbi:MAG: hypothetical protein HY866_07575 [Chloroflexi bacterium]|nr:hypothetical protein [Chloroflexota bacterium]
MAIIVGWVATSRRISSSNSTSVMSHAVVLDRDFLAVPRRLYAERWVRTVREACLDQVIILNKHHLRRTLNKY